MNNLWTWTDEDKEIWRNINYRLRYLHPVIYKIKKDANWVAAKLEAAVQEIDRLQNDLEVEHRLRDEYEGKWEAGYAAGWDDGRESLLGERTNTSNSSNTGIVIDEAEV
jgi:hypothetical protein